MVHAGPRLRTSVIALVAASCGTATPASAPQNNPAAVASTAPAASGDERSQGASDAAVSTTPAANDGDAGAAASGLPEAQRRYAEAMAAYERGDYAGAARGFEAAHAARPGVDFAFNAGRMHERLADVPNATRWYETVLASNPEPARRADVTARIASLRDFARRRREDIAQPPPDTDAMAQEAAQWFRRGVALYQRRQYAQALRAFEAANQFVEGAGRTLPELMFNLAVAHEHLGHNAEAASAFRSYLAARPDSPDRAMIEERVRRLGGQR